MGNWLSTYNYDYALATIPVQVILMVVYYLRQQLPTRKSYYFWLVMVMNLFMTITDIWSCEFNEVWQEYPLSFSYALNMAYFFSFILRGWALFAYAAEVADAPRRWGNIFSRIMVLPALIVMAMVASTPWTAAIFTMDPITGYHNTGMYYSIYLCTWFYIFSSLGVVFYWRREMSMKLQLGLYIGNMILAIGLIVRHSFMNTLVTSFFSLLVILIIYLTSQNPDSFRDRKVDVFNRAAFSEMVTEFILAGVPFSCLGICVKDYTLYKAVYSPEPMYASLANIGAWLSTQFKGFYIFYFGNGQLVLLNQTLDYVDVQGMTKNIQDRFRTSWQANGGVEVPLGVNTIFLSRSIPKADVNSVEVCLERAFTEANKIDQSVVYVVDEQLLEKINRQEKIKIALGRALRERSLEINLQPMYSVKQNKIPVAEVLARLYDDELGYIPPQEFIPIAEKTGDIMELGRQIFAKTCHFISDYDLDALGIEFLTVNLSPAQCMNKSLGEELERIANRHKVSLNKIRLEITESAAGDMDSLKLQMQKLEKIGVRFLLDDFGAGTSNLVRLLNLPFVMVKIDMQLVWSYFRSASNMFTHILKMFRDEKMAVIVEGVEDKHMAQTLADMGCEYEQGYYFSPPLATDEFVKFIRSHHDTKWLD